MKIFVTGAGGFIGKYLVRALRRHPYYQEASLYALIRNPHALPADIRKEIQILEGGSNELEKFRDIILDCDYIFHLAGNADLKGRQTYQSDNVDFTNNLISIAAASKKLKRLIFTSTVGAVDRLPEDSCAGKLTEASNPHPLSRYGKSKLECEKALEVSTVPYVIIRPALVYGPEMRKQSHIRVFIEAVRKSKIFTRFYFPGKVSVIHASDLAEALLLVGYHAESHRGIYFAAEDHPVSLGEIFLQLGRILGNRSAGKIKFFPPVSDIAKILRRFFPIPVQNLFSDVLCVSNEKLKALGFYPQRNLYDGLLETAHWHCRELKISENDCAVVTGAAGGIGKALSEQLYARGHDLILIDFNEVALLELAKKLNAVAIAGDLSSHDDRERVISECLNLSLKIGIWINNAGIGKRGEFCQIPRNDLERMIGVNILATVALSHAILNVFIKKKRGVLVNIASSSGLQPLPYMAVYGASKAFVNHFSQALEGELLSEKEIKILTILPSGTKTDFQKKAGVNESDREKLLDPYDVSSMILQAIRKGSGAYVLGRNGKLMSLLSRILPSTIQIRLWRNLMRKYR